MKVWSLALVLTLSATFAFAQTPTPVVPTSVRAYIFAPGVNTATAGPLATIETPISQGSLMCNLTPVAAPTTPVVNPTVGAFTDPFNAGRQCQVPLVPVPTPFATGTGYQVVYEFVSTDACDDGTGTGNTTQPCLSGRSAVASPLSSFSPRPVKPATPKIPVVLR